MRRDIFQAIADPTRRAILGLLALQAMTPNALAEHFNSTRQAVSKHIKILTECEVVKQKQTGREIYYHFDAQKMKEKRPKPKRVREKSVFVCNERTQTKCLQRPKRVAAV